VSGAFSRRSPPLLHTHGGALSRASAIPPLEQQLQVPLLHAMAYESADASSGEELVSESASAHSLEAGGREGRYTAENFPDPGQQVLSLLKPVCVTMAIVVYLTHELTELDVQGGFSQMMVYQERDDDTTATKAGGVLLNSLVMVGALFVVTTGLLLLYKLRCYRVIYGWLMLSVSVLLFTFGGNVAWSLVALHEIPVDAATLVLLLYNFAAVGTLLVFWTELGCGPNPPKTIRQAYLVIISALLAWSATKLPEWSTWGLLAAVSLWDIIAVLTPRGPLKLLVEEAEKRGDPIPGLVYEGADIKLGLGDFVFYSLLVGRASMGNVATLTSSVVAVLTGLLATLALLPILDRVLPALPISIAIGIGFYFASWLFVTPLLQAAVAQSVFL